MNRSTNILDALAATEGPNTIMMAPNAPPVTRTGEGVVELAMNIILDATDVMDTLIDLRSRAPKTEVHALSECGQFSFGLREVGRIRVNYTTQRGSKVILVSRIPYDIPNCETLCKDGDVIRRLVQTVISRESGILTVSGPSARANSMLVYSLLKEANMSSRRIIFILERSLTYLMAHGDSIIIQSELGGDVSSMDEGLQTAFPFEPDIIYVGDVRPNDDIPSAGHAGGPHVLAVFSSVSMDGSTLLSKITPQFPDTKSVTQEFLCGSVTVVPAANNTLRVEYVK